MTGTIAGLAGGTLAAMSAEHGLAAEPIAQTHRPCPFIGAVG